MKVVDDGPLFPAVIIAVMIALFSKPAWKPMKHKSAMNIEDLMK